MARILIIDDNPLIGRLLYESLTAEGHEARTALNANDGYSAAIEFMPELVLLDIQLPDVTGYDLCRLIKNKAELSSVPIIMITGAARSTEDKVKGFQMGVDDYILKPFDLPELTERVHAVLRRVAGGRPAHDEYLSTVVAEAAPAAKETFAHLKVLSAISQALWVPGSLPEDPVVPGISLFFLLAAIGLALAGSFVASGAEPSAVIVGVSIAGLWGLAVSVLVMACTLFGIRISWKQGARVVSLAASPLLLKMVGALVFSITTTLSPFYYSAGLSLFWPSASAPLDRLDGFEIWSAVLLWLLLRRRPNASKQKAGIVALVVWAASAALALVLSGAGRP